MNDECNGDPEPLQTLLASAFAVQESRIDAQRLSAIVEIRRLIADSNLNLDEAMNVIAELARQMADASGSAIGLLKSGQLVYRAGRGSAATFVGRRVMATLSGSAPSPEMAEILRVENADLDTRIQSAICRQFEAKALLILPIYCEGLLSGVLEIFFSQPHEFAEQEVRAYRQFAELVGEAISPSSHVEHKEVLATKFSGGNRVIESSPASSAKLFHRDAPLAAVSETVETTIRQSGQRSAIWMRTVGLPFVRCACDLGVAAVVLLAVVSFLLYGHRSSMSQLATSPSGKLDSIEHSAPGVSTQQVADRSANDSGGRDVMMRDAVSESRRWPSHPASQVKYFGDNVTVRYFAPKSAIMKATAGETEIRRMSDDVSVRYFKPRRSADTGR